MLTSQLRTDDSLHLRELHAMTDAVLEAHRGVLDANGLEFFSRVWSTDPDAYLHRVNLLGFAGLDCVLDAGCGMGQWTHALATLNAFVHGVDISPARTSISSEMNKRLGVVNTAFSVQSIEKLAFGDGVFDGIYCYSVIYATNYRIALQEFRRVLRPGGRLYVCGNGLGWYLRNLVVGSGEPRAYDVRKGSVAAMWNTLASAVTGSRSDGSEIIVPSTSLKAELHRLGFQRIARGGEGTVTTGPAVPNNQFFRGHWMGLEGVYEVLAIRGNDCS